MEDPLSTRRRGPAPGSPPARRGRPRNPTVRWEKIALIREQIARGTYDTPDKWEKMLDRLLRDVRRSPKPR